MQFNAKYVGRQQDLDPYWRTIHEDSLAEAQRKAERYVRKGYLLVKVVQILGKE